MKYFRQAAVFVYVLFMKSRFNHSGINNSVLMKIEGLEEVLPDPIHPLMGVSGFNESKHIELL